MSESMVGLNRVQITTVGSTAQLQAQIQEDCTLLLLVLDGDLSTCVVTDVKVGGKSLFKGAKAAPAGAFAPNAQLGTIVQGQRVKHGQRLTVFLQNIETVQGPTRTISGMYTVGATG